MQNESSWSITIRKDGKAGRFTLRSEENMFVGMTLDAVLSEFHASVSDPKGVEPEFHGFRIGDVVRITSRKTEIIISASGLREGFPASEVDHLGKIVAFDRKTRSLNTVGVTMSLSGKTVWGSHRELRRHPSP